MSHQSIVVTTQLVDYSFERCHFRKKTTHHYTLASTTAHHHPWRHFPCSCVVLTCCVAICVFPEAGSSGKQSKQPCYTKRKASWISWPNQPIGGAQPNSDVPFTKMETPDHGTWRHYHHASCQPPCWRHNFVFHCFDAFINYTFASVKCYLIPKLFMHTDTVTCRLVT